MFKTPKMVQRGPFKPDFCPLSSKQCFPLLLTAHLESKLVLKFGQIKRVLQELFDFCKPNSFLHTPNLKNKKRRYVIISS